MAPLWKTDVELEEENLVQSDPICNSSGCTQYKHPEKKDPWPINYGVPNFGVDHDVLVTKENYHAAEGGAAFDPFKISPEAYETEWELAPIWSRKKNSDAPF